MRIIQRVIPFVALVSLTFALHADAASPDEEAAIAAAGQWLELVDTGQYSESWKNAAGLLQRAVSEEQWQSSLVSARGAFGKLISRSVQSTTHAESLPGAPDGRYVVIQYQATFEHKKAAIETVTPMMEKGKWRVSGYYIK